MLEENDFRFDDKVSLNDLQKEPELVEAELISDMEEIKSMSLSAIHAQKKALKDKKTNAMLSTDKMKLEEVSKINNSIEKGLSVLTSDEFWEKMAINAKGPQDFKFMAEGLQKLMDARQRAMRLDSIDGEGNARKIAIGVRFEDDSGSKVDTVIKVGD